MPRSTRCARWTSSRWCSMRRRGPGTGDEYVSNLLRTCATPVVLVSTRSIWSRRQKLLPLIEQAQQWHDFAAIVPVSAVDRRRRRSARARAARAFAGRRAALSRRFPDRSAGARRSSPRRCARRCCSTRAPSCRSRPRSSSTSSTRPSASGCCASTARSYVEQESQKPIVIGRGGEMIKRIGTEARQDLEALLRDEGVPGSARESERRLAQRRPHARRARRAADGATAK